MSAREPYQLLDREDYAFCAGFLALIDVGATVASFVTGEFEPLPVVLAASALLGLILLIVWLADTEP